MGATYEEIDEKLRNWLLAQPMFVVATAPLSGDGHVNVSPKGMSGTFAVLGPRRVAYLDYTGSGAETIAHLRENGRITLMFTAFTGPPKIVRLSGRGHLLRPDHPDYPEYRAAFGKSRELGIRSIVIADLDRIADSCGFSVPLLDFVADRDLLDRYQERRDDFYFPEYWRTRNATSIDNLPALDPDGA